MADQLADTCRTSLDGADTVGHGSSWVASVLTGSRRLRRDELRRAVLARLIPARGKSVLPGRDKKGIILKTYKITIGDDLLFWYSRSVPTITGCSVLKCPAPGELMWSTGETMDEFVDWGVCRAHHRALRSGVRWATHSDLPNSATQWLVMGSDLDVRTTEALDDATVSIEYTESGKEVRIEFLTGKEKFDVLLDEDQLSELGEAVAEVTAEANQPSQSAATSSGRGR